MKKKIAQLRKEQEEHNLAKLHAEASKVHNVAQLLQ